MINSDISNKYCLSIAKYQQQKPIPDIYIVFSIIYKRNIPFFSIHTYINSSFKFYTKFSIHSAYREEEKATFCHYEKRIFCGVQSRTYFIINPL